MRKGWQEKELGDICELHYGKGIKQENYCSEGKVKIYGTGGLIGSTNLPEQHVGPSIIIGRKGSINSPLFIEKGVRFRVIDTAYYLTTKQEPSFIYYLIDSINLNKWNEASGVPSLNRDTFYSIKTQLPPIAEQKKIAAILRTWDDAIEKAEKVKEKEKRLWKGERAQTLLALGKKFGFSDIGEITSAIVGGGTPSRSIEKYWNGNIPWVSVKDMVAPVLSDTQEHISEVALRESASNLIPAHTPIVSTRMAVGRTVYFTVDVAINQDLKACIPKKECNPRFLFHCLRALEGKMASFGTGSTVNGITLDVLREQIIPNPDKKHQLAFVALADSRESEINLIEKKITLLKSQKRGLMQKLLTGAWPVQVSDKEAA